MKPRFKPIKCSNCKEFLGTVYENQYWTYSFEQETGTYKGDMVDIEIRCPNCNALLREEFPEGVCNYQDERLRKS